jgi:hypothetical protein
MLRMVPNMSAASDTAWAWLFWIFAKLEPHKLLLLARSLARRPAVPVFCITEYVCMGAVQWKARAKHQRPIRLEPGQ